MTARTHLTPRVRWARATAFPRAYPHQEDLNGLAACCA